MSITDAVPVTDAVVEDSHRYFVDSTEADQGVATSTGDKTIKDHVDAIGTTKNATLYLLHDFDADETDYTLTTSETIPSNITLKIEPGAIIDGAGTLTIESQFKHENVQCFGSSITIAGLAYGKPQWWGAIANDDTVNDTTAIQACVDAVTTTKIPSGNYRVDTPITVETDEVVLNYGHLRKLTAYSANTDPVLYVIKNNSRFSGGEITTQNAHASGIVVLGHESTTANYDGLNWRFEGVDLNGVQTSGNVGIRVPSGQVTNGVSAANYFGYISNINIKNSDIGIEFTEISNAHTVINIQFWNMITAAYWLHGAYGNSFFGGFLHTSTDGVIGIVLDNKDVGSAHDSIANSFFGFHFEPGGATSKSVTIESGCSTNSIWIVGNVTGGRTVSNDNNFIFDTMASVQQLPEPQTINVGKLDYSTGIESDHQDELIGSGIDVAENTKVDLFSINLQLRRAYIVDVEVVVQNLQLDIPSACHYSYNIGYVSGTTTATALYGAIQGTGFTVAWDTTTDVDVPVFSITTYNNGTATTYDYSYKVSARTGTQKPTITLIN